MTTVARFIGSHAVWDIGPRIVGTRYGDFEGTATIAPSRGSGLDLAVAFNFWVPDAAKDHLLGRIGPAVDAAGLKLIESNTNSCRLRAKSTPLVDAVFNRCSNPCLNACGEAYVCAVIL